MYRVTVINGEQETVIHSPYPDPIKLESGVIYNKVNEISTFSFVAYPDMELDAEFFPLTTLVKVFNTKTRKYEFEGRLLDPTDEFNSQGAITKRFECESELAYLHDTFLKYQQLKGKLGTVFQTVLNLHNELCEPHKHFEVGDISQVADLDVDFYTVPEISTYETIFDEIVKKNDLYIDYHNANGKHYINLYKDYGRQSDVDIAFTVNMVSLSKETQASNIITRLIPLGDRIARPDIKEKDIPQDRVTIESVNGGLMYLDDPILIQGDGSQAGFGVQMQPKIFEGVTDPATLKTLGNNFLAEQRQKLVLNVYKVEALNLFLIDLADDDYELGNYHRVHNKLIGIDEVLQIVGTTVDIVMPDNSQITIGDKWASLEDYQRDALEYRKRMWRFSEYTWRQNEINRLDIEEQERINQLQEEMLGEQERINDVQEGLISDLSTVQDKQAQTIADLDTVLRALDDKVQGSVANRITTLENFRNSMIRVIYGDTGYTGILTRLNNLENR